MSTLQGFGIHYTRDYSTDTFGCGLCNKFWTADQVRDQGDKETQTEDS